MGENKIKWMYFDLHTTIRKVFLERMNRARNDYLRSSKNANTVFQSYKDRNNYSIKDFKWWFERAKNSYIKMK